LCILLSGKNHISAKTRSHEARRISAGIENYTKVVRVSL
jgi:hypothetical protein